MILVLQYTKKYFLYFFVLTAEETVNKAGKQRVFKNQKRQIKSWERVVLIKRLLSKETVNII